MRVREEKALARQNNDSDFAPHKERAPLDGFIAQAHSTVSTPSHTHRKRAPPPAHIYCSLPSSRKAAPKPLAACVCMEAPLCRAAEGRSRR